MISILHEATCSYRVDEILPGYMTPEFVNDECIDIAETTSPFLSVGCGRVETDLVNEITIISPRMTERHICPDDLDLGDDVSSFLLCSETMSMCEEVDTKTPTALVYNMNDIILRDEAGYTIIDMAQQMKHEFGWLQHYVEYSAVRRKREDEIAMIQQICQVHAEILFRSSTEQKETVVSCVALLDWLVVENVEYFCAENANRIACLCVLYGVRTNLAGNSKDWTESQGADMLEIVYDLTCCAVYGETSDIGLAEIRFCEEQLHQRMMAGSYKGYGLIRMLELYDDMIDDAVRDKIVCALYKLSVQDIRYRHSSVYFEFVETFIKLSGCTQTNTRVMFDCTELEKNIF